MSAALPAPPAVARTRPRFRGTAVHAACKKRRLPLRVTHALLGSCKAVVDCAEIARRRRLFDSQVGSPAGPRVGDLDIRDMDAVQRAVFGCD